jgi:hypothetical protein
MHHIHIRNKFKTYEFQLDNNKCIIIVFFAVYIISKVAQLDR